MDEQVVILLDGLAPGSQATVRAQLAGYGGSCVSDATFVANAAGRVDLDRDAPVAGSYQAIDGMGLFWSMRRVPGEEGQRRSVSVRFLTASVSERTLDRRSPR